MIDDKASLEDVLFTLKHFGMTFSFGKDQFRARNPEDWAHARLFIPAKHSGLNMLFSGTPWAGKMGAPGPWLGVLRQMPKHLCDNGKCDRGLDKKASGIMVRLSEALDWDDTMPVPIAA